MLEFLLGLLAGSFLTLLASKDFRSLLQGKGQLKVVPREKTEPPYKVKEGGHL